MADSSDIETTIGSQGSRPKRVKTDLGETESRSADELIAIQQHLAANEAADNNEFFGLRVRKARLRRRELDDEE